MFDSGFFQLLLLWLIYREVKRFYKKHQDKKSTKLKENKKNGADILTEVKKIDLVQNELFELKQNLNEIMGNKDLFIKSSNESNLNDSRGETFNRLKIPRPVRRTNNQQH